MSFWTSKKPDNLATEIAALKSQLESAKRRITALTLENIQQANELLVFASYRPTPAETPRPLLTTGKEMKAPPAPANSEIGLLFAQAVG